MSRHGRQSDWCCFDLHEKRFQQPLCREILARYVGQTDQIRASLQADPQLEEALGVLRDDGAYRAVLAPR